MYRFVTLILIAVAPFAAIAGGSAIVDFAGHAQKMRWKDAHTLRMDMRKTNGYMLVRGDKAYTVINTGGHARVLNLSNMAGRMRGHSTHSPTAGFGTSVTVKPTGKTETVAGIRGHVFLFTSTDDDGNKQTREVVLTNNPLVQEMTRAYLGLAVAMAGKKHSKKEFLAALPKGEQGLLRSGDDFRVKSISATSPPDHVFELPAKARDMGAMMRQMMQKMHQQH